MASVNSRSSGLSSWGGSSQFSRNDSTTPKPHKHKTNTWEVSYSTHITFRYWVIVACVAACGLLSHTMLHVAFSEGNSRMLLHRHFFWKQDHLSSAFHAIQLVAANQLASYETLFPYTELDLPNPQALTECQSWLPSETSRNYEVARGICLVLVNHRIALDDIIQQRRIKFRQQTIRARLNTDLRNRLAFIYKTLHSPDGNLTQYLHDIFVDDPSTNIVAKTLALQTDIQKMSSIIREDLYEQTDANAAAAQKTAWLIYGLMLLALSGLVKYVFLPTIRKVDTEINKRLGMELQNAELNMKYQFVASMSHEIRTPLNGVVGNCELLLADPTLNSSCRESVDCIKKSGHALVVFLNDLLEFSKIESGRLELEHIEFNLRDCIEDMLALHTEKAFRQQVHLSFIADTPFPAVLKSDPVRFQQIINNLITNAIKFTPVGGEVSVHVSLEDTSEADDGKPQAVLCVKVIDTGIGISEDNLANLFQGFSQANKTVKRKYGGFGLGLSICKRLCDRMGGQVRVDSIEGVGSTFSVTMPFEVVPDDGDAGDDGAAPLRALVEKQSPRVLLLMANEHQLEEVRHVLQSLYHFSISPLSTTSKLLAAEANPWDAFNHAIKQFLQDRSNAVAMIGLHSDFVVQAPETVVRLVQTHCKKPSLNSSVGPRQLPQDSMLHVLFSDMEPEHATLRAKHVMSWEVAQSLRSVHSQIKVAMFADAWACRAFGLQMSLSTCDFAIAMPMRQHVVREQIETCLKGAKPLDLVEDGEIFDDLSKLSSTLKGVHGTSQPNEAAPTPAAVVARKKSLPEKKVDIPSGSSQTCILVVDDNKINRRITRGYLTRLHYKVEDAVNGKEALEKIIANYRKYKDEQNSDGGSGLFRAILLDCHMPVMDGFEAAAELRKLEASEDWYPRNTIIALTAAVSDDVKKKVLASGMNDIITKPCRLAVMKATLMKWNVDYFWYPKALRAAQHAESEPILQEELDQAREMGQTQVLSQSPSQPQCPVTAGPPSPRPDNETSIGSRSSSSDEAEEPPRPQLPRRSTRLLRKRTVLK